MAKLTGVSKYFALRQRFIDNKKFLVLLAKAKTEKAREKQLKAATERELFVLKDLILNIAWKNIEIAKDIFHLLERKKKVKELTKLISIINRSPQVSGKKLRILLLKFSSIIPYILKSILK